MGSRAHRPQTGAEQFLDADDQAVLEGTGGTADRAIVHLRSDVLDLLQAAVDFGLERAAGGQRGVAQPVADHAVLVGIGDRAALQGLHGLIGGLDLRLHCGEEVVVEIDTADVDRKIELLQFKIVLGEAFPGRHTEELRIKNGEW